MISLIDSKSMTLWTEDCASLGYFGDDLGELDDVANMSPCHPWSAWVSAPAHENETLYLGRARLLV
jgi:hypothetical protein